MVVLWSVAALDATKLPAELYNSRRISRFPPCVSPYVVPVRRCGVQVRRGHCCINFARHGACGGIRGGLCFDTRDGVQLLRGS